MLGFFIQYRFGNVKYSRHVYGGAADIFIDENPKDEMMDDFFSILQIRSIISTQIRNTGCLWIPL